MISIIVLRVFLFLFNHFFLSFENFQILVSKIISHMRENHGTVPLALIKFSQIENFNAKVLILIEISYKTKL